MQSALPDILTAAQRFGFAGLNITHPCKQAVIPLLDDLSPDAAALGAVNTVVLKDGRRVGHNTDWWGFAESFRRELPDVRATASSNSAQAAPVRRWRMRFSPSALARSSIDRHRCRAAPITSPPR